jgi:AcrR family transcriptional regulator
MALFARQGYEETTVEDVARAAGMSRRTFFRHFPSKEDILLSNQREVGESVADELARRPGDEPPWLALRRAFDPVIARMDAASDRTRRLLTVVNETPALQAAQLARRSRWRDLLVPRLLARLPPEDGARVELRAEALVCGALACYEGTHLGWLAAGGAATLSTLLDESMTAVAPLR